MLQSDTMSLSLVVPALLVLSAHLSEFPHTQGSSHKDLTSLTKQMKANLDQRFSCFLNPSDSRFSPLATAASFLDPTVSADALIENDDETIQELLSRAEDYIAQMVSPVILDEAVENNEDNERCEEQEPQAKQPIFRLLSTKVSATRPSRPSHCQTKLCVKQEIQKFKEQLSQPINEGTAFDFWAAHGSTYQLLKPLSQDLLAMPASQAFAERVFSIAGDLSQGRRNRARLILERSAFLKMNQNQ